MTILDRLRIPVRQPAPAAVATVPTTGVDLMEEQRILGADIDGNLQGFGSDLLGQQYNTALGRRLQRPNAEITEVYAAVFAGEIMGSKYPEIREAVREYRQARTQAVLDDPDPRVEK